jgi:hypothetical protein
VWARPQAQRLPASTVCRALAVLYIGLSALSNHYATAGVPPRSDTTKIFIAEHIPISYVSVKNNELLPKYYAQPRGIIDKSGSYNVKDFLSPLVTLNMQLATTPFQINDFNIPSPISANRYLALGSYKNGRRLANVFHGQPNAETARVYLFDLVRGGLNVRWKQSRGEKVWPINLSQRALGNARLPNGGSGTLYGGSGGYGSYDECSDDGCSASTPDDERELSPGSLLLRRLHRTPLYAEVLLVSVLGAFTGVSMNIGAWRWVRRDNRGWWWMLGSLVSWGLAIALTCLIG